MDHCHRSKFFGGPEGWVVALLQKLGVVLVASRREFVLPRAAGVAEALVTGLHETCCANAHATAR